MYDLQVPVYFIFKIWKSHVNTPFWIDCYHVYASVSHDKFAYYIPGV